MMPWLRKTVDSIVNGVLHVKNFVHVGRCPYCSDSKTTSSRRCREFQRIAFRIKKPYNTRLETYRTWTQAKLQKEHERIKKLEDRFFKLRAVQPSPAAEEIRAQIRASEVIIRNELIRLNQAKTNGE